LARKGQFSIDMPETRIRGNSARRPSFVLVHGAWHDARAWDHLQEVLDHRGCRSVAVDLPAEDVTVDASGYAQLVAAAAAELGPQPPTIVGHSLAGITIPLVTELTPVGRLVYLAALIPRPGETIVDVIAQEAALGAVNGLARDDQNRSYWTSAAAAIEVLYHDCAPAIARAAAARLRPQARTRSRSAARWSGSRTSPPTTS
jgi:pimeloyl-ACP methyl ester carboxylesterase